MTAYATLDELLAKYRQTIPEDSTLAATLGQALTDAAQGIDSMLGFDFNRHPATETEVRTFDGPSGDRLCVHDGIVPGTATQVEVRTTSTGDWTALDDEDWMEETPEKPGHPAFHLVLTGVGLHSWHRGPRLVRITAAFGWPAVPADVKLANIHRARQLAAWDPTLPGGPIGPEELGMPSGPNRLPDTMWRLKKDYSAWELGIAQCDL